MRHKKFSELNLLHKLAADESSFPKCQYFSGENFRNKKVQL